jgi:hypothetical protein
MFREAPFEHQLNNEGGDNFEGIKKKSMSTKYYKRTQK